MIKYRPYKRYDVNDVINFENYEDLVHYLENKSNISIDNKIHTNRRWNQNFEWNDREYILYSGNKEIGYINKQFSEFVHIIDLESYGIKRVDVINKTKSNGAIVTQTTSVRSSSSITININYATDTIRISNSDIQDDIIYTFIDRPIVLLREYAINYNALEINNYKYTTSTQRNYFILIKFYHKNRDKLNDILCDIFDNFNLNSRICDDRLLR